MSGLPYAMTDSLTMLRRSMRHMRRYPALTLMIIGLPVVFLLIFTYVFGGALGAGLPGASGGRAAYLAYVVPGILLLALAGGAQGTAISVAMDMTEGITARFRTMAVSRAAILAGHVIGSVIQTMLGATVVTGVALLLGFRPAAGPLAWAAVAGLLTATALAVTWLCVALGLAAKSVESASNLPMFLMLLPFLGSGFVPTATMPAGLRAFAEYQPFTPVMQALRALLSGAPAGRDAALALAWCAVITLASYLWARRLFSRYPVR